jgi:hypothetical protein
MKNDGGPAFPSQELSRMTACGQLSLGMSLRDYFAGQALAGLMALPDERTWNQNSGVSIEAWRAGVCATDARQCYRIADAMLAAREATNE